MGMACTRVQERLLASVGVLTEASTSFAPAVDVKYGGVLCALPALEANGLFRHLSGCLSLPKGYYGIIHIILTLAFMALCRIKSVEQLRYHCPGELGKILGLDRIPEVRTLREKINHLCEHGEVEQWSERLGGEWMAAEPLAAGVLYVDGHVRVYHGSQTKLPRRYVSRERLCLRGVSDYWVNDLYGRPYFVVSAAANPGLLSMLKEEIVPRLRKEVPAQPSAEQLQADRFLPRFTLVFDREGYSPGFMKEMWQDHRIACLTYHKYPGADWPEEEFQKFSVPMPQGENLTMELAERGTYLGRGKEALWVREIRKRRPSGAQTSLIGTHYQAEAPLLAASMFSRWSQENFLKYMMENYNIDALGGYALSPLADTQKVLNPHWRQLDGQVRSVQTKRSRKLAEFGALQLNEPLQEKSVQSYTQDKAHLKEQLDGLNQQLEQLKSRRRALPKHLPLGELDEADRFAQIAPKRKQLLDTIKMLAYRAETAMAQCLSEQLGRTEDRRPLLRELYQTEANLLPDPPAGTLTVELHHMSNRQSDRAIASLLQTLNEAELNYPGTDLRLVYKMVSSINPRDQEL